MSSPLPEGTHSFRWLGPHEDVPAEAFWFDAAPDYAFPTTEHESLFACERSDLQTWHNNRKPRSWPSNAHGLCGIVVPTEEKHEKGTQD